VDAVRVIGPGRAGRSVVAALEAVGGVAVDGVLGRADPVRGAGHGVDVLIVATPDDAIAGVAGRVEPDERTVVVHLSGACGLDVLAPHPHRASLHPLVALPDAERGARRLREGATFALSGSDEASLAAVGRIVAALGGTAVVVPEWARTAYHAAAAVAANHLVALLGQVERIAAQAGLPLSLFEGLVRGAVDDAFSAGPARALTGPAARGDRGTLQRHRDVLAALPGGSEEVAAYDALVAMARRLASGGPAADRPGVVRAGHDAGAAA
jgi:predicted short-subunit dehydrogenase-like oxidoreductase (DUF2520 family)